MPSFLTGSLWKVATGGAALIALVFAGLLISSYFENRGLVQQRDKLAVSINDPATGYIAQLSQVRTNERTLQVKLQEQNEQITKLSREGAEALARTRAELVLAKKQTAKVERQLAGFLATTPQGATLEDRIRDIDERAMKEFLP